MRDGVATVKLTSEQLINLGAQPVQLLTEGLEQLHQACDQLRCEQINLDVVKALEGFEKATVLFVAAMQALKSSVPKTQSPRSKVKEHLEAMPALKPAVPETAPESLPQVGRLQLCRMQEALRLQIFQMLDGRQVSIQKLGEIAGVSASAISRFKNGETTLRVEAMNKLQAYMTSKTTHNNTVEGSAVAPVR